MWRPTRLNFQEPLAYLGCFVAASMGWHYGVKNDHDWLGRAGSVMVVIGVLLAASRKVDVLRDKTETFLQKHLNDNSNEVRRGLKERFNKEPTDEEVSLMQNAIYAEARAEIEPLIQQRRRIFKLHEILIVISGTLLNGFGSWLITIF